MSVPDPISPLAGAFVPGHYGASGGTRVRIVERRASIAEVLAPVSGAAAVATTLRNGVGLDAPKPGAATMSSGAAALWIKPASCLVIADGNPEGELARKLMAAAAAGVAIVDQSHGKAILTLSGARARSVMAKGCRLDLHARAFRPGQTAVTQIAHIGCIILQRDEAPTYDLIVPATFARAFLDWLTTSADEFGFDLVV